MIREVQLLSHLPEYIQSYREIQKIMEAETPEVQRLEDKSEVIKDNQFISFCEEEGIKRYEELLGVIALDDDTLENRRFRVLSAWNNYIPYTMVTLKQRLEMLCGVDGYLLELRADRYFLKVQIALTSKKNYAQVEKLLQEVVPCNLMIHVSLLYNKHSLLRQFTHRQLSQYTHRQIRNEVL